jgi:hypothetical protein
MIEKNNPHLDVDELMTKIHERIEGSYTASLLSDATSGHVSSDITTLVAGIEVDLIAAESASQVRTSLGKSTRFVRSASFQTFVLRALAFIFRDQRNVNAALIAALRKSMHLNVRLAEELDRLKSKTTQ